MEIRLLPSDGDWKIGVLHSFKSVFKEKLSRSLKKTFLGFKTGECLFKKICTSKGRERIRNYRFPKVNISGKGKSKHGERHLSNLEHQGCAGSNDLFKSGDPSPPPHREVIN